MRHVKSLISSLIFWTGWLGAMILINKDMNVYAWFACGFLISLGIESNSKQ